MLKTRINAVVIVSATPSPFPSFCFVPQYSYLSCDDITGGFSGAELIAICRDAAMHAIEEEEETKSGDLKIAMRHLMRSVKGTKKQITSEMIKFYDRFRRS